MTQRRAGDVEGSEPRRPVDVAVGVLIDAQGRVLKKIHGSQDWDGAEALQLIGKTLRVKL